MYVGCSPSILSTPWQHFGHAVFTLRGSGPALTVHDSLNIQIQIQSMYFGFLGSLDLKQEIQIQIESIRVGFIALLPHPHEVSLSWERV
jgi:hypothetical protein